MKPKNIYSLMSVALAVLVCLISLLVTRCVSAPTKAIDEAQLVSLEHQIIRRVHSGEHPKIIEDEYRKQVLKDQTNKLAVFGWAFATLESAKDFQPLLLSDWLMEQLLAQDDPRNLRAYTRVRFVLMQEAHPSVAHPDFYKAVEAFLQETPQDMYLRVHLVYDLENDKNMMPKATALAQQGVAVAPNSSKSHWLLASVYGLDWILDKRPADAQLAVDEYRKFLALAPAIDPFRRVAQFRIDAIRKKVHLEP